MYTCTHLFTDDSYLVQKKFFHLHLTKKKDSKIHGFWVWKLVNTKLKFNYGRNLNIKKSKTIPKQNRIKITHLCMCVNAISAMVLLCVLYMCCVCADVFKYLFIYIITYLHICLYFLGNYFYFFFYELVNKPNNVHHNNQKWTFLQLW